jgi:hypothetical protein
MMTSTKKTCPLTRSQITDRYFMEHRAKLIDIAAFLDRLDRAADGGADDDFRVRAFRDAMAILQSDEPHRAKRVLDHFSDHSTDPIDSAKGMKGAHGACPD